MMAKSYKAEVSTDATGKFNGNALRFATVQEAKDYVFHLSMRWTGVRDTRVGASDDPVNYPLVNGRAEAMQR